MDMIAEVGNTTASVILRVVLVMESHVAHGCGPSVRVHKLVHTAKVVLLDAECVHLGEAGEPVDRGLLLS